MGTRNWLTWCQLKQSGLLILVGLIGGGDRTLAQVTADPSLGTEVTTKGTTLEITGGTTVGGKNLFHSFSNFSVKPEEIVDFRNTSTINNILVRVTGGNPSDIQGRLKAQGNANLFVINPNGILLRENVGLNIGGSFIGTTASVIQFPGGGEFSMTSSVNPLNPLLSVNPSAFLFNQIASESISSIQVNPTRFLSVPNGKSLLLVGGDVKLEGGILEAEGGRVELGGLAGAGTVGLNIDSNNFHLSFPNDVARADVSLTGATTVSTNGTGGGSVQVQGKRVQLTGGSTIETINTSGDELGGTLAVTASEVVELFGGSRLLTTTEGSGNAGNIRIDTGRLTIQDGSQVSATTKNKGRGGTLFVTARESIYLIGSAGDPTGLFARTEGGGDAGDLRINTGQLIVQDGAQVSASTLSGGRGGTLFVTARDSIQLNSKSGLFVGAVATGDAGSLEIETGRLIVQDGAIISASTSTESSGQGGNILVGTGQLDIRNGALITVESDGSGDAGSLTINANSINLDQGKLAGTTASGRGGDISLQVQDLILMRNGSAIATTADNNGSGGNIRINAPFIVADKRENSDILANANFGSGGRIEINATGIYGLENRTKLTPSDTKSEINASSNVSGLEGVVEINTPDVDPSQGLVELPVNLVDASGQIAQGCTPRGGQTSSFVATGRGGLPLSPSEPLRPRAVITQWVTLDERTLNQKDREVKPVTSSKHSTGDPEPIVEAQGWVKDDLGNVYLVAQASDAVPSVQNIPSAFCTTSSNGL